MNLKFSTMTLKGIGKTILAVFGLAVIAVAAVCGMVYGIIRLSEKNYAYEVFKSKAELSYYSSKDKLIEEIDTYIHNIAPTTAMNGIAFVEACDKYKIDVKFAIAQCQVESAFATTGIANKTKSAFNVLAYDGRSAKDMISKGHCFKHPDKSIEPYLELLTTHYLIGGKTEMDLLDNFVNDSGKRYASSVNYEHMIRNVYNTILTDTNINAFVAEYEKYKMICGK